MATAAAPRVYKNFINGEWVDSRSGSAYENRNPANTDELIGMFVSSNAEDVDLAVDAANLAYKKWRLVPAPKRAEILFRAAELLRQHKENFSKDMTREMGKVLAETRGDVQEAIDMTYYMAGEGRRLFGQTTPSGIPASVRICTRLYEDSGVSSAGFSTTVLPLMRAGMIFQDGMAMGKFHGVISPHEPIDWRMLMANLSGSSEGVVCPNKRRPSPAM